MKVELVQLAGRDGDVAWNLARTLEAIHACADDSQLVVFPETQLTGFPTEQNIAAIAESIDGPSVQAVQQAAREKNLSVAVGFAEAADDGRFYNTTLLITPQGIAMKYRKTHLFHFERTVFSPGGNLHVRGARWVYDDATSDARFSGKNTVTIDANFRPAPVPAVWTGPVWGTFRLENAGGFWEGTWTGERDANGFFAARGVGHGGGGYAGLLVRFELQRASPIDTAPLTITGTVLDPHG